MATRPQADRVMHGRMFVSTNHVPEGAPLNVRHAATSAAGLPYHPKHNSVV
jgi:hypothetical protein